MCSLLVTYHIKLIKGEVMYQYNQKMKKSLLGLKAKFSALSIMPIAFILLVSPMAVFAKSLPGTIDTTQTTGPVSYNIALSGVDYTANQVSISGGLSISNFVDREDGQNVVFRWGDGSVETVKLMTMPGYYKSSGFVSVASFTKSHSYNSSGPWSASVSLVAYDRTGKLLSSSSPYSYQTESEVSVCNDGSDNDRDGRWNLYDNDCADFRIPETTLALCSDRIDNDVNGVKDLFDPNCAEFRIPETTLALCSDGLDNDVNQLIDLKDPNCAEFIPKENTVQTCSDGIDNNLNGLIDLRDPSCVEFVPKENTAEVCLDAIDNDLDGRFDWEDSDCAPFVVPIVCETGFTAQFVRGVGFVCVFSGGGFFPW